MQHMDNDTKKNIKDKIRGAIENNPDRQIIKRAMLFGSYAYGSPNSDSDIDLIVELDPSVKVGFFKFAEIQRTLGEYAGKKVDLLTKESLSKYFRDEVLSKAELVYEG